ncbi:hypothetical protein [Streptomyces labedae]|uniref:Uncharacterized protein n=1 Tax=Streptomyces labedae TaxID=285569 RepID=A0ABP6QPY3_9ACTN
MAGEKSPFPDDESAVAELLERWHLGLGLTLPERRLALRQAREQSSFDLPETVWDDVRALPSVARVLAGSDDDDADETGAAEVEPYEGAAPGDDDEDDELEGPDDDEDFYADALEDA